MSARRKQATKAGGTLPADHPCAGCGSACCRYLAVHVDPPADLDDCDVVRWYLHHRGVCVYVDREGDWYVQVGARCKRLGRDGTCTDYERRPNVCRDYSHESCERADHDVENIAEFTEPAEFDAFVAANFRVVGRRLRRRHRTWRPA